MVPAPSKPAQADHSDASHVILHMHDILFSFTTFQGIDNPHASCNKRQPYNITHARTHARTRAQSPSSSSTAGPDGLVACWASC